MTKSSVFTTAISLIFSMLLTRQDTPTAPIQIAVNGIVVSLGPIVLREDNRCRQLMVVRPNGKNPQALKNTYLLVARNYDCSLGAFTNEHFRKKQKWTFSLTRGVDCDRTYGQIKDMPRLSPEGIFGSDPFMKLVPGNDGKKLSADQKLLCYEFNGQKKHGK